MGIEPSNWPKSNLRFNKDTEAPALWIAAEKLINFGGKGHKVIKIDSGKKAGIVEDTSSKNSVIKIAAKVSLLALLTISVIGAVILACVIASNRSKFKAYRPDEFLKPILGGIHDATQSSVEANHATLKEKDVPFSDQDVQIMRDLKLSQMEFQIPQDNADDKEKAWFIIFDNVNPERKVSFSNRVPTRGELRGSILRNSLKRLSEKSPDMFLYDAIQTLISSPGKSDYVRGARTAILAQPEDQREFISAFIDHGVAQVKLFQKKQK